MATPVLIDLSNYSTHLVQSTQSRAGTPDGNIFFDTTNGTVELITAEELSQVDLGSGLEDNPLTNALGILKGALYAFERQERRTDEELRKFEFYSRGTFKFAGAYELVNGRKYDTATSSTGDDRTKIRGSGWIERATNGNIDRIYFGVRSLGNIESASQPYYQLAQGGAPVNFAKAGSIDEAIQVFGDTANGDSGAGDFSSLTFLSNKVRTFGFNYDEKTLADSGITEMSGYSSGFALGETPHLTTGDFALADVYGGSQIAPWTGMSLEKLAVAQTETGFNEADGDFTWVLHNTGGGTLDECVAFLDALAQTDDDIDDGAETTTNGKRVGTWYDYNAQGQIVTKSGADTLGLYIENIPTSDEQRIVFTDDAGDTKTRPFTVEVRVSVGAEAAADPNAWYHAFYKDGAAGADFGTASAVTVNDSGGSPVKGDVSAANTIVFSYDYDGNNQAGLNPGEDKEIVFQCEGDGGATAALAEFTITRSAVVTASCTPGLETNV